MLEYNKTDQYLHQITQVIAKCNRSFIAPKPDDSHTNLFFDALSNRIVGRPIKSQNNGSIVLALTFEPFSLQWINELGTSLQTIPIVGNTYLQLEKTIAESLEHFGLFHATALSPMHYSIPEYAFRQTIVPEQSQQNLLHWAEWRSIANEVLHAFSAYFFKKEVPRIWPHHFDTGVYFKVNDTIAIGAGLAMQDTLCKVPYFYFTPYYSTKRATPISYDLRHGTAIASPEYSGATLPMPSAQALDRKMPFNFYKDCIAAL